MKHGFDYFEYDQEIFEHALTNSYEFLLDNWQFLEGLGFTYNVQCKMIDIIIKFFSDKEEYEKCSELVKIKNKIIRTYKMLPKADRIASGSLK